ncbi:MAG: BatA and WFA domain-containing protein [Fuerstiella sp.]|nr:BatA and WFA domain-containing protein [Fuerstiella sp.]
MTFINLSLLFGLGLVSVPVILHLTMRSRPKRIEFPALRLLETRRTANARRLKLRHLLLLLLRMSVLAAVVLALTRPYMPPAHYGLSWFEWLLTCFVIAGAFVSYKWFAVRAANQEVAGYLLRERVARIRSVTSVCGVLAMLVIVGVPWGYRVGAEVQSPQSDLAVEIPVSAVFIFDTSISMSYRHESRSRLEQAKEIARDHLQTLPSGSRVAVAVTGASPSDELVFQSDLAAVNSRVESLKTTARMGRLNSVLHRAFMAQRDDRQLVRTGLGTVHDRTVYSREVVVFTDLSKNAWSLPDDSGLHGLLKEHSWLHVFLVDLSVTNPVNLSLRNLKLSADSIVAGRSVDLSVDVVRTKAAQTSANVEVFVMNDNGDESRAAAPVHVQLDSESVNARMLVPVAEDADFLAGIVRISSSDPLKADDVSWFSLGIQPRPRILLVADKFLDAANLLAALESHAGGPSSQPHYDCTFAAISGLHRQTLTDFDVVCMVNCQRPRRDVWRSLHEWVQRGGSLLTVVGGARRAVHSAWNVDESESLLPARILRPVRFRENPESLRYEPGHAITRALDDVREARTQLLGIVIRRRWIVEPSSDSRVIMSYTGSSRDPALLERRVGEGRSLMLTTAVDYTQDHAAQWNELPVSYTFFMLADGMMQYLTGATDQRRNFRSGAPIEIRLPADNHFDRYLLRRPGPRQTSGQLTPRQRSVLIDDADQPGHYRLWLPDSNRFRSEFAVNIQENETDLTPITTSELDTLLGENRCSIVSGPGELKQAVDTSRMGIEVFPILIGLLVILFCSEHLMANYFYDLELPTSVDESV